VLTALQPSWETVDVVQVPLVQVWVEVQVAQGPPVCPQAALVVPGWQLPPATHPVQQVPPRHLPPVQSVPSALLVTLQLPVEQLATLQVLGAVQVPQSTPALPQ
jgi:hypothetical protein